MATADIESLNSRFGLFGAVRFEAGNGGLTRAVISTPLGEGHVYLHGAHVTHYQPANQKPLLFVSRQSMFEAAKPIRGGVPICFPWFGPRMQPPHGFARLSEWAVESTAKADDGSVRISLAFGSDATTKAAWPHDFKAKYTVTVGAELRLALEVFNTGSEAFTFEEAMHTYLSVADVRQASIEGLEGMEYVNRLPAPHKQLQGAEAIRITGETDRIYLNTRATTVVHDPVGRRNISVAKDQSLTTVVWNPWIEKAKAFTDFADDEWPLMVCVETCNVGDYAVALGAGKSHTMAAVIQSKTV